MQVATAMVGSYLERFETALARGRGEPDWLADRRKRAMERFLALGLPTRRDEEYKYTDLSALASGDLLFDAPERGGAPAELPLLRAGPTLAFDGPAGARRGPRPLPEGVRVLSVAASSREELEPFSGHLAAIAPFEGHALCALSTAFFADGAIVEAAPGAVVEEPVHLAFGDGAAGRLPRVLVVARRGSSVRVVETYSGAGTYWRNAVTEVRAEENARVDHYRAQVESEQAYHTGLFQASQARDSYVGAFSLSFGAAVARNDVGTRLAGPGCECSLDGLYAVRDRQHVDHHTAIDHAMPHCNSHQLYKGVLDDRSRGVFNGKIFVRRDAQKTDAVQSNKNLLLSDAAEVNTKPQLEIDANDVRCTHGATIGQLDAASSFYLRSRGIGAAQARAILTYAFAADALERIRVEPLKKHFADRLLARFAPRES